MKQVIWLLNMYARGLLADELQSRIAGLLQQRQQVLGMADLQAYQAYLLREPQEARFWEPFWEGIEASTDLLGPELSIQPQRDPGQWLTLVEQMGGVTTWEYHYGVGVVHLSGPLAQTIQNALDPGQELSGMLRLVHPSDRGRVQETVQTVLREAREQELTYGITLPDGQLRYLRDRIRPITDTQGQIKGLLGVKLDITAFKLAEQRLAESEERYRRLVEDMQVPMVIHQDEKVVFANQAALQAVRANRKEDFVGQHIGRFVRDRIREPWLAKVQALYRSVEVPSPYRTEMQIRRLDGSIMHVESGGMSISYYGRPAGQLYFLDVTEQREVFNLSVQSQLRLDLSQEVAQVGSWEYDYETKVAWWSDALYKIFGVAKTEMPLTMDHFIELVHPDDLPVVFYHLEQTEKYDAPYEFDHRIQKPDGEVRYFHASGYLFRDKEGKPRRLIGATQDITERKQREQEIQQLNQTLERRVTQRTEALKASNDELRRFAYSVSHDLRAPLRHLMSYSQLLMKHYSQSLDEVGKEFVGFISQAATRMDDQVAGLLTYSRLGQHLLDPTWVDSRQMIEDLWPTLLTAEQRAEVELYLGTLPPVYADAFLLEQVWANLLSNAVKYSSRQAQPKILIEGHEENGYAIYQIADNGIGFDMKDHERLFVLFQRLPGSQDYEGTGIGLANVKRIVDRHQGEIWAEAVPGQGATFYVKLPCQGPAPDHHLL